jgi:hypothetical protein
MPTAYYQKMPVAGSGKALFVVGSTLEFRAEIETGRPVPASIRWKNVRF